MAAPIPTEEPSVITAGDSPSWKISLSDYPASESWVLNYALMPVSGDGIQITFSGSASGADHLISLTSATTLAWLAGEYSYQSYVTKTTERYTVKVGSITVAPDYATSGVIDTRTKTRRILDFIDSCIEKVTKKQVVSSTVEGVSFTFRSLDELLRARNYWEAKLISEDPGRGGRRNVYAQFSKPA